MTERKSYVPGEYTRRLVQSQPAPDPFAHERGARRARNGDRALRDLPPEFDPTPFEDDDTIILSSDGPYRPPDVSAKERAEEAAVRFTNGIADQEGCTIAEAFRRAKERRPDLFLAVLEHNTTPANVRQVRLNALRHEGFSDAEASRVIDGQPATISELSQGRAERMVDEAIAAYQAEHAGASYDVALQHVAASDPALVTLALGRGHEI